MRRRPWPEVVAALVTVAGVAMVGLGILLATAWKPSPTTTVRVLGDAGTPLVETAPGALSLAGRQVRVAVNAQGAEEPVFLGVGRTTDVEAYLGDVARRQLTGIDAQGQAVVTEQGEEQTVVDPAAVDIWVASVGGRGAASLTWPEQPGRWTLVAATDGGGDGPESVTFTWTRDEVENLAPAVIAMGVLLLVAGVVTMAMLLARAREEVLA